MGTDFDNTKTECHFLMRKCERLFLVKNYNNSTVQQNCEPGNYMDNNNCYKGCQKFKMFGILAGTVHVRLV